MTDNRSYINWWCGGNPVCHSRTGINLYNIRTIFPVDLESSYCNIQTIRPSGKLTRASSSCTVVRLSDLACVCVRVFFFFFNCGIVSPTVHIFRLSTRAVLCTSPCTFPPGARLGWPRKGAPSGNTVNNIHGTQKPTERPLCDIHVPDSFLHLQRAQLGHCGGTTEEIGTKVTCSLK